MRVVLRFLRTRRISVSAVVVFSISTLSVAIRDLVSPPAVQGVSSGVVISQVYGGGGNSGARLTNDFIELFNRGATPIDLSGWSVQYASSSGTSWQVTALTGAVLQPGQYYLIQEAAGSGGTAGLPTPDAIGTIAMSATAGKVALVNTTTALSGNGCPFSSGVIDFVGYGTGASCSETSPTANLSATTAAIRTANGCTDTDSNSTDFATGAPNPRNTASPVGSCAMPTNPSGVAVARSNPVRPGNPALLTVGVTPGANPISSGLAVHGDLTSIGGSAAQAFFDDGINGDAIAGDYTFSYRAIVPDNTAQGLKTLPITITDAQSRTGTTSVSLNVHAPPFIVISQIYAGGGDSSSAPYTSDFIELYNQGGTAIDLSGWSVQSASATETSWQVTPLAGTIAPGQYYLVQLAAGPVATTKLPAPDATGEIAMNSARGKVALVSRTTALSDDGCPFSDGTVDFVGYGGALCSEGGSAAPSLSNTTAAIRARGGCRDTNNNATDFIAYLPAPRNSSSPLKSCSVQPPMLAINAIQGSSPTSPNAGQEVNTIGIVTALKTNGFFLQTADADADADPNTSEALFVFTSTPPAVAVAETVSVIGTVAENFGLTQIFSSNLDVVVTSGPSALPAPVTLTTSILDPAGALNQLERLEGMRVHADSLVSIAPTNEFGEIFTVLGGVQRPLREPGIENSKPLPPGAPCCVPRFDENPERLMVDSDGQIGSTALVVTAGVTLTGVTGPLDFTFGGYKLLPDAPPAATANLAAIPAPVPTTNEFTIGSFNLENFYSTNANFAGRLNKASLAIRNVMLSPDIIGVEEVGDLGTLTALADKVNSDAGAANPNYQAYLIESDEDAEQDIDVGFLIKTSRVNVVSITQEGRDATYINPLNGQPESLNDRAPLVLRATIPSPTGSSFPVTVIVNHLRSLIDIDQDPGDGPRVREKRRKQAEFLANLVQSLQSENLVLVGDFNAYQFSDGYVDVIGTVKGAPAPANEVVLGSSDLVNPDLSSLAETLPADQGYSFNFGGNGQTLDHVLVDGEMLARSSRFAYARNNSDFPDSFGADATRPERVSDHDMPVAYFTFPPPSADLAITLTDSPDPVMTGATITYTITITNHGPDHASNVRVIDPLPIGAAFATCNATGGGVCGGGGIRTVTFASLAIGATETIKLTAVVDNDTPLTNAATVSSSTKDPNMINNLAMTITSVSQSLR